MKAAMNKNLDLFTSSLASSLRMWRGTWGDKPAKQPAKQLVLFDREDSAECRLVREALTELNLDATIYPCPAGGKRFAAERKKLASPTAKVPVLHDPNNGQVLIGAEVINTYLFTEFLDRRLPSGLKPSLLNLAGAGLAGLVRGPLGMQARASHKPKQMLTLYSFESSPYSRPVREVLCALELPYHLVNMGKLEWADMGPATMRFAVGPYKPKEGSKREAFLKEHGKVQLPFLVDPNHDVSMFESSEIVDYLERTYAK
jgi:glutathione S-transferase